VCVIDKGPGIALKDREKIFQRFYQNGNYHKATGLGLAIVKEIITAHGGTISIDDNVPNGTCFAFSLN
jgi:two-component system sensor histidine kinase KdpD